MLHIRAKATQRLLLEDYAGAIELLADRDGLGDALTSVPGVEATPTKFGSPSSPAYGYDVRLLHEETAEEVPPNEKGVVAVIPPLPPGCMSTVWGQDERFVQTYFTSFRDKLIYTTFDWGIRDEDNYYFILGRTDDVINVAGHRLGTREIEEAVSAHDAIAEVAVVGVADQLKGQGAMAFVVVKDATAFATSEARLALEGGVKLDYFFDQDNAGLITDLFCLVAFLSPLSETLLP